MYLNRKKEDLVHSKFEGIRNIRSFVEQNFRDKDSSKFTGRLDKGWLDSVEYGICKSLVRDYFNLFLAEVQHYVELLKIQLFIVLHPDYSYWK